MVKIVVRGKVPEHRLSLSEYIVSEEKVVGLLSLTIQEGIVVVSLEAFQHVPRVTSPLIDLPVGLHGVYKVRSTILNCNRVTMVMKPVESGQSLAPEMFEGIQRHQHVSKQVDCVSVVLDDRITNDSEGMQLMAKS